MNGTLLARCQQRLIGVHPDLVRVVTRARKAASFVVTEGLRTPERQQELVRIGASRTLDSRHLTGHAVDIAYWLDGNANGATEGGEIRWDWPLYAKLAAAMRDAARAEGVAMVWGGAWDRRLDQITGSLATVADDYAARMRARGRRPFLDGPHFELDRSVYR
ncbi:D-alanyl-D-alanine carboxypeptidase [Microcystis phage MJing1]|nr:D-alanyl-D-alanine carboxypeptidase [Microcystis phage MJing1]